MPRLLMVSLATPTALIILGCGSGSDLSPTPSPPEGFAYAYASPSCAPWDGPAVQILLTSMPTDDPDTARPQLRLVIYPREIDPGEKSYRWPTEPEMATGARCTVDSCEVATTGEIRLGPVRADSGLEGTVTLRFASNEVVTGGFRAVWQSRRMFCG